MNGKITFTIFLFAIVLQSNEASTSLLRNVIEHIESKLEPPSLAKLRDELVTELKEIRSKIQGICKLSEDLPNLIPDPLPNPFAPIADGLTQAAEEALPKIAQPIAEKILHPCDA